jgi:hypothetical protein
MLVTAPTMLYQLPLNSRRIGEFLIGFRITANVDILRIIKWLHEV